MGQKFDEIIDSPVVLARFMDELLVRISAHALLEDYRYQRSINQLIVIYFMVRRITEGDTPCPRWPGDRPVALPARSVPPRQQHGRSVQNDACGRRVESAAVLRDERLLLGSEHDGLP